MRPPVLALDLDGTLVDTAPDLIASLNDVLARERLPLLSRAAATNMIGAGARALVERGLAAVGAPRSKEEVDAIFAAFLDIYTGRIAEKSRPYPGALAAVERFTQAGWKIAVCTNKLEGLSRRLLEELGIADRFAAIAGGDTFDVKKPDGRHLSQTIALAGGDPGRSVMVGDSETDVATARSAGIAVVGVDFGYTTTPMAALQPDRVIGHFDQLWDAVASLRSPAGAALR